MVQTITHMRATWVGDPAVAVDRIRPAVIAHRAAAEAERRLLPAVVEELRAGRFFALTQPVELGGPELALHEVVRTYEALARLDGPMAWNVWNGSHGFVAAMLSADGVEAIWDRPDDPIIANSARVAGLATPVDGGYRLSGRWDLVSAIDIADWVALFAAVDGRGEVVVLLLPRGDYEVLDTWHTSGMRATGSNTVVVDGAFVPAELAVSPFAPARIDRPLYRIPAFTIASSGAAPIVIGMAQAAIDEVLVLAATKPTDDGRPLAERPHAHHGAGIAQTALDAARALIEQCVGRVEDLAAAGRPVDVPARARLRAAMSHAAGVARDVFATCGRLASSAALYTGQPLERILRDGGVATAHGILAEGHADILGRVLLGQDPATPVI